MPSPSKNTLLLLLAKRVRLMKCIKNGFEDKRELEESIGLSRSALNEALRQLNDDNMISSHVNETKLTLSGMTALSIYEQIWEPYTKLHDHLDMLSIDQALDPNLLIGANVVEATFTDPEKPIDQLESLIRMGNHVKWISPVFRPRSIRFLHNEVTNNGLLAEMFLYEDSIERLLEKNSDQFSAILNNSSFTLRKLKEVPPFGLTILDEDRIWMGIYDDKGRIACSFDNDTKASVEWALDYLQSQKAVSGEIFLRGGCCSFFEIPTE